MTGVDDRQFAAGDPLQDVEVVPGDAARGSRLRILPGRDREFGIVAEIGILSLVVHAMAREEDHQQIVRHDLVAHLLRKLFDGPLPAGAGHLLIDEDGVGGEVVEPQRPPRERFADRPRIPHGEGQIRKPKFGEAIGVGIAIDAAGQQVEPGSARLLRGHRRRIDRHLAQLGRPLGGGGKHLHEMVLLLGQRKIPGIDGAPRSAIGCRPLFDHAGFSGGHDTARVGRDPGEGRPVRSIHLGGHDDRFSIRRCAGLRIENPHLGGHGDLLRQHDCRTLGQLAAGIAEGRVEAPRGKQPRHHVGPLQPATKLLCLEKPGQFIEAAVDQPAKERVSVGAGRVVAPRRPVGPFAIGSQMQRGDVLPGWQPLEDLLIVFETTCRKGHLGIPRHRRQGRRDRRGVLVRGDIAGRFRPGDLRDDVAYADIPSCQRPGAFDRVDHRAAILHRHAHAPAIFDRAIPVQSGERPEHRQTIPASRREPAGIRGDGQREHAILMAAKTPDQRTGALVNEFVEKDAPIRADGHCPWRLFTGAMNPGEGPAPAAGPPLPVE